MTELLQLYDVVLPLVNKYKLINFIETGCYLGDGIKTATELGFRPENIYSCDINQKYIDHCRQRFGDEIKLFYGKSDEKLKSILNQISQPCLFFLDAHLPKMYGLNEFDKEDVMPIYHELLTISNYDVVRKSVIICDDTRIIKSDDNVRFTPGENICCEPVENLSIKLLTSVFENSHDVVISCDFEGYLLFTPKA